jgi:heptosyltransferase-2
LIIKLGALGDVLRTTPLLRGLREQWPEGEITWLTSPAAMELLADNPLLDRLWTTGPETLARLQVERFDRVICLDKEPEAIAAASLARAERKYGFGMTEGGRLAAFNQTAVENLRLGLSDELKFRRNAKTYQQLAFETAELDYSPRHDYVFTVPAEAQEWADEFIKAKVGPGKGLVLGFNFGGADVFAHKQWKLHHFLTLRQLIADVWGGRAAVLGLGGPWDQGRLAQAEAAGGPAIINTGSNPLPRFAALLKRCAVVVTGDSLAMHLALAVGARVVVLLGSTTPREIELYGRGRFIVSDLPCAPCYRRSCDKSPDCMELLRPEAVLARLIELVEA